MLRLTMEMGDIDIYSLNGKGIRRNLGLRSESGALHRRVADSNYRRRI